MPERDVLDAQRIGDVLLEELAEWEA